MVGAHVSCSTQCAVGPLSPRTGPAKPVASQWDGQRTPESSQIKRWERFEIEGLQSHSAIGGGCRRNGMNPHCRSAPALQTHDVSRPGSLDGASPELSLVFQFLLTSSAFFGYPPSLGLPAHSRGRLASPGSKGNDLACKLVILGFCTRRVRLRDLP